jgi:hypothetical protein
MRACGCAMAIWPLATAGVCCIFPTQPLCCPLTSPAKGPVPTLRHTPTAHPIITHAMIDTYLEGRHPVVDAAVPTQGTQPVRGVLDGPHVPKRVELLAHPRLPGDHPGGRCPHGTQQLYA